MSEMIERVADAIWKEMGTGKSNRLDFARAAIEAMREPTDEMKQADEINWGYSCHVCGGLTEGWHKMIDAALKETPDFKG